VALSNGVELFTNLVTGTLQSPIRLLMPIAEEYRSAAGAVNCILLIIWFQASLNFIDA
jgi:hypothetical protein